MSWWKNYGKTKEITKQKRIKFLLNVNPTLGKLAYKIDCKQILDVTTIYSLYNRKFVILLKLKLNHEIDGLVKPVLRHLIA